MKSSARSVNRHSQVCFNGEHFADSQDPKPFFDALVRASQDLQGDARYTDEYLQIIADYTDQPLDGLQDVPLYTWESDLRPLPDQLTGREQVWLDSGALNNAEPLDEDNYIDSSFADEADGE
jgi:NitT/TauT family transport system substrate-binding protein